MTVSMQCLRTINRIVEELSPDECKRLSYLCGKLDADQNASMLRETLQSVMVQVQTQNLFLMELMLRMRRYDLLRSVMGVSKRDAEGLLKNAYALSEYRVLMAELSEDFGSEDLGSLIFLLRGTLPKEKLEKSECFLDVVVELEKCEKISSSRTDEMERYLRDIHRLDLVKRLSQYRNKAEGPKPPPAPIQNGYSSRRELSNTCAITSQPLSSSNRMSAERQDDVYRMESTPRGVCVIIDCVGSEGVELQQLFESLHFTVSLHMLLGVEDVISTLRNISKHSQHRSADAFVCCIISRTSSSTSSSSSSSSSRLLGTDSSGPGLTLDAVRRLFGPDSCPGLSGKPKLFFIQGYEVSPQHQQQQQHRVPPLGRGEGDDYDEGELQTDAVIPGGSLPNDADVFWSHCWTPERQLEDNKHQSLYLQTLREALLKGQRRRFSLLDVHMEVNRTVFSHSPKNPGLSYDLNLRHTLRKQVYLS